MKITRFWGIATLLGGTVLAAIVWLAPAVHGQDRHANVVVHGGDGQVQVIETGEAEEPAMRAFEILGGRGSQIGVGIKDLADADLKAGKSGVQVEDVRDSSPAAQAGVKAGDVFTSFDGERVRSARQFARLVQETPAGRSVKAQVWRDGKTVDLTVTPSAGDRMADRLQRRFEFSNEGAPAPGMRMAVPHMPHIPELPEIPPDAFQPGENFDVRIFARPGRLGVNVQGLTPDLAEYFGVKDGGVLVTAVTKDSAAAKAGIKAGDVITSVNGKAVEDAGELRRQLPTDDSKDSEVSLGLVREKKPMTLKVPFEAAKPRQPAPGRRTV